MTPIQRELALLCQESKVDDFTKLKASVVHDWAQQHEDSAIHASLEWDDSVAGHQYRLEQIRRLLRVNVVVLPQQAEPVRTFVSLTTDRKQPGGGYRLMAQVLSDAKQRQQLLADALAELLRFQRKYARLQELSVVFTAIATVAGMVKPRKQRKLPLEQQPEAQ